MNSSFEFQQDQSVHCFRCKELIHFFLSRLEEYENMNQRISLYIQQSIASAFTLSNLINDLLDLAKMESATFILHPQEFNMFEVVAEAFQILIFQAQ